MGERLEAAGVQVWAGKRSGEHLLLLLLPTAADVYRGLALLNLFIRLFEASISIAMRIHKSQLNYRT